MPWDINGWDITKALSLMFKSNAVVLEWLTSPVVYSVDPAATELLRAFADDVNRRGTGDRDRRAMGDHLFEARGGLSR